MNKHTKMIDQLKDLREHCSSYGNGDIWEKDIEALDYALEMLEPKREDKQTFCNALCQLLRMTRNLGDPANNALAELRYVVDEHGNEYVVPVFEDGSGEPDERNPHGYYAVGVSGDNCMGILVDVVNGFIYRY